jgi:3-oxoadipate enol-lactonase
LLLLPGYAVPASSLDGVRARLSHRFECFTVEYPGSGTARTPWLPLTVADLAVEAVRRLDELNLESAHVYGPSFGGLVAQEMAIRFPERVRALILVATTPGGARAAQRNLRLLADAALELKTRFGRSVRLSGLVHQGYAASLHDTLGRLDRIQAKTLIIHGGRDGLVPVAAARLLHEQITGSTLIMLPDARHSDPLDYPTESAAVIVDWFDRSGPFPVGHRREHCRLPAPIDRALALPIGQLRAIRSTLAFIAGDKPSSRLRPGAEAGGRDRRTEPIGRTRRSRSRPCEPPTMNTDRIPSRCGPGGSRPRVPEQDDPKGRS